MNPLCITWPPILYTDYGRQNIQNFINVGGFDNLTFSPNGKVMRELTKLSIKNASLRHGCGVPSLDLIWSFVQECKPGSTARLGHFPAQNAGQKPGL